MMVDRSALIETMAQSIGQAIGGPGWWAVAKHDARAATRREAMAAIAALESAGYVVMPRDLPGDVVSALSEEGIPSDTIRLIHDRLVTAASEEF
jgi:hypothetical protein